MSLLGMQPTGGVLNKNGLFDKLLGGAIGAYYGAKNGNFLDGALGAFVGSKNPNSLYDRLLDKYLPKKSVLEIENENEVQ